MRRTRSRASLAQETSRATMRRSRIVVDAGAAMAGVCGGMLLSIAPNGSVRSESLICSGGDCRGIDQVNTDRLNSVPEVQHASGAVAEVHDSATDIRTAI